MQTSVNTKPFAEVIQSSLAGWTAQSWKWDKFALFGSLVTVQSNKWTLFGIVHQMSTGSADPVRAPMTYQKTEEELLAEQPQIFEFLKTTFSCLTIGYQEKGTVQYLLAPEPPKIHAFVQYASREQYQQFFASENFLHVLFGMAHQVINIDELLLAILRNLAAHELLSEAKITKMIEIYSLLTANDYRRLKLFLQRAEQLLK